MIKIKNAFKQFYQDFLINLAARQSFLLTGYFKYIWKPKPNSIEAYIENFGAQYTLSKKTPFVFLQIGANNGLQSDPIFKLLRRHLTWRGILVEPQKEVFETQLQKMYKHYPNISLINAAIDKKDTTRPIYKIAFSKARWATGLASFSKETLIKHIENGYIDRQTRKQGLIIPNNKETYISTETVKCVCFSTLLEQYSVKYLDLLIIDTEGFDFEIIKMIDFNHLKPALIVFEYIHLTEKDLSDCKQLLANNGYTWQVVGRDIAATCH